MVSELLPPELLSSWESIVPYVDLVYPNFSEVLPMVVAMVAAITIYGILIYHFYRFLAKRDVFKLGVEKYRKEQKGIVSRIFNAALSLLEYGLAFPIVVFLWFGGFSLMLFLLAKNISTDQVLLVSVVFVSAIRAGSYYTEDLSRDLAKMIPFALLGVALIDPTFFSVDLFLARISSISTFLPQVAGYLIFLILLEWLLRILLFLKHLVLGEKETVKL